jgi:putative NADH-flavin reductase
MAHILVIGGTKGIGLETVKQALERGHMVRAFSRKASQLNLDHPNLEKLSGDACDPEDVAHALADIDLVVQAIGVDHGPRMILGPVTLFSDSTRVLGAAMKQAGIKRLISITGFGAGDSRQRIGCLQRLPFELFLGRAYNDKGIQERLIQESDLQWIIVRPTILTNGSLTGRYHVLDTPREWRNGLISRADVADFVKRQVETFEYAGKTPVLTY